MRLNNHFFTKDSTEIIAYTLFPHLFLSLLCSMVIEKMPDLTQAQLASVNNFVSMSVTEATRRAYERDWTAWTHFIESTEAGGPGADPFLKDIESDLVKSYWISLFILRRYQAGFRGVEATKITAAIRYKLLSEGHEIRFLGSDGSKNDLIAAAKRACRLNPAELRSLKWERKSSVKLPINLDMMISMRERLWANQVWDKKGAENMMTYIGCMWGMEIMARCSEYTLHEPGRSDHCIRARDISFMLTNPMLIEGFLVHSLPGGDPTLLNIVETDIEACIVDASSHKCESLQKTKTVTRRHRHPGESEFLNDIIKWIKISKVQPYDELFTRYMALSNGQAPTRKVLTGSMVRKAIKFEASLNGFPTEFYPSHSLRKAGRT